MKQTPHKIIAEPVIQALTEAIERGDNGTWSPPWRRAAAEGLPLRQNGKPYTGINLFLLSLRSAMSGYESRYWFTFKEAKRRGWQVRKGEKSTAICFYKTYDVETDDGEKESRYVMRYYRVFNGSQIDGIDPKYIESGDDVRPNGATNFDAVKLIKQCGIVCNIGGTRAFYSPGADAVTLPDLDRFESDAGLAGTALHELTHATGHESRLARKFGGRFGDHAYAAEELVAELGATILCATFGFEYKLEHHASYLEHWHKALKSNPNILASAGAAAQQAANWVLENSAHDSARRAA